MRHMIFGESHGPAIGVVLEGVPAGLELDLEAVQRELDRRKPGQDPTATARRESDTVQVLSGVFEGKTTGAPLAISFPTPTSTPRTMRPSATPRPGHGDYAGFIKSQGCQDYRGGGHFSGRLTAPGGRRCGGPAGAGPAGRAGGRPHQLHLRHHRRLPGGRRRTGGRGGQALPVLDDAKGRRCARPFWRPK